MGSCVGNPQDQISINMQVIRAKKSLKINQDKLKQQGQLAQEKLIKQFMKDKRERNKLVEEGLISQIVLACNKIIINSIVIGDCTKIIDNKQFMGKSEKQKILIPSLRSILYCTQILNVDPLSELSSSIKLRYPSIQPLKTQQIKQKLIKHHKNSNSVTASMQNDYIMRLCTQENLSLEKINQVGHNFKYGN